MTTPNLPKVVKDRMSGVADLCRAYHVKKLELFGSATQAERWSERSDLDFIVTFASSSECAWDDYTGLYASLGELFSRPIDLITSSGVRNPYLQSHIDQQRVTIFAT